MIAPLAQAIMFAHANSDDTADGVTMIVAFATNDDCGVAANDEFIAVAINVKF